MAGKQFLGKVVNRLCKYPADQKFRRNRSISLRFPDKCFFFCFMQKFKMAAKSGGKNIFGKSHQYTLQIPCGSKIHLVFQNETKNIPSQDFIIRNISCEFEKASYNTFFVRAVTVKSLYTLRRRRGRNQAKSIICTRCYPVDTMSTLSFSVAKLVKVMVKYVSNIFQPD